jgi:hypothetical protein
MAAPSVGIDLLVFIGERRLKSSTMQVQFDDIASGEPLLWQVGEEKFVDDARTCDAHRAFLFARLGCVATTTRQGMPSGPTGIWGQS